MVKRDVGDDARQRYDDVRRVEPTAKAGFPNYKVAFLLRKTFQRHDRDDFKQRQVIVSGKLFEQRLDFFNQTDEFIFRNQLTIDLNPFAKRNQMRRGEQPDPQSGRAINAFEHRAGRAFAVRSGDMDEAQFFLRIARERGEMERVFQPEIRAEHLQAVKKLDGFGISHGGNFADYRSTVKVMS